MEVNRLWYVELVLVFVAFLWGLNPPIMKIGLQYLPPVPYNAMRMIIAVALAVGILKATGAYCPVRKEDWKYFFGVSLLGFFVFQLFFTWGVQQTTAGNASVLLGMLPVCVAVINKLFRIEKITRPMAAGILVSLAGVAVMVAGSGKELSLSNQHLLGACLILFAQTGYGHYTVFSKRLTVRYSAYQATAYVLTISAFFFCLISVPSLFDTDWTRIPLAGWLSILYSGVFGICIGNFLWIWGIGKLGSTKTAIYNNLSPVFAISAGWLFLHETFGAGQMLGTGLIFIGLWLARRQSSNPLGRSVDT